MKMVMGFTGQYRFLSNFYLARVVLSKVTYPTVEHAYQAAKTTNRRSRKRILNAPTPATAKSIGYHVTLRKDWDNKRLGIMKGLLRQKFTPGTGLARRLLYTEDWELVEVNTWHDKFWGVCDGEGENHLGKLLMEIRGELRKKIEKRRSK